MCSAALRLSLGGTPPPRSLSLSLWRFSFLFIYLLPRRSRLDPDPSSTQTEVSWYQLPRPVWELFRASRLTACGAPYRWLHEDERATTKHLPVAIHFGPHLSPPTNSSWRESTRRGAPRMAHLPSAPPSSPPSLALPLAASRAPRVRSRPGHRMDGELLHRPRWPACECVGERLALSIHLQMTGRPERR